MLAFSIFGKTLKTRELGQCILWKNFAQNENNTEIPGVFANAEKFFWRRGKKIFQPIESRQPMETFSAMGKAVISEESKDFLARASYTLSSPRNWA
jgi:hypothetical protein